MKILLDVLGHLSPEIEHFLSDTYPPSLADEHASRLGKFACRLHADNPVMKQLLEKLKELGYKDILQFRGLEFNAKNYVIRRYRVYEPRDYDNVEWFALVPAPLMSSVDICTSREEKSGSLVMPCNLLNIHQDIVSMCGEQGGAGGTILVTDRVASVLREAERYLDGLKIRPVIIDRPLKEFYESPGWKLYDYYDPDLRHRMPRYYTYKEAVQHPWWELDTDTELPPVSPSMKLAKGVIHLETVPVGTHKERTIPADPDGARPTELHYRRSDMDKFSKTDVVRSWEVWGSEELGTLIVSQKFYRWWVSKGFQTGGVFVPVRIDENL